MKIKIRLIYAVCNISSVRREQKHVYVTLIETTAVEAEETFLLRYDNIMR